MLVGTGLMLAPIALQLGLAAAMTGVVIGSLAVALSLAGTETSGRGTIPLAAQAVYDRALGVGLVLAAAAFGVADMPGAMVLFALVGAAALLVTSITRYSASAS
jgi:hypothetical protein